MDNDNLRTSITNDLFRISTLLETPNTVPFEPKEIIKCFVCDLDIFSRSEKDRHVQAFPHKELTAMRFELIRMGIDPKIFNLIKNKEYIICTLCNVVLQKSYFIPNHLNGKTHNKKLRAWSEQQSTEKASLKVDTMWYFCKKCNISLDGTSDAEKHYESSNHESQK